MIDLRPALPSDIDNLWALRTLAVRVSCATHYSAEQIVAWSASAVPASYAGMIAAGGGIVALHGDAIAGYAMLDLDKQEVDAVFVDPGHGGLGIGKRLLAALEAVARERGIGSLQLSASLNAEPFYQAAAFVALREDIYAHRSGVKLACVAMVKMLDGA